MSTTYLVANAIENLIHDRNIKELDPAFNFLQTIIVATLIGLLWEFGSFTASTLTVILWLVLLFAHALSFHFLNRSIPLADTFFASALVSIFAAVRRLKGELKDMAAKQAKADAKNEVARIQSLFLTDFASWLKTVTQLIVGQVRATQPLITASNPRASDLYRRAFSAGEEFNDYLESIRQIPELENLSHRAKKTRFDVRDFVQKITRRFEIKAQEKSIVIDIDIADNASDIVANASLLDSIVFNFVSNAVKYSPNDSRIVIRGVRNSNREYVLSVIDSGPGIPDSLRDRIFEKFYRIQDERIYNSKGSGLGLYLSKYFAEGMGGRVDVISSPNGGSEFRVILP
jgi:signal transduction histidine kinase